MVLHRDCGGHGKIVGACCRVTYDGGMRTTTDTPADVYHSDDGHISRSTIHMANKYGPDGYRLMLEGVKFFAGSAATRIGAAFDELVERRILLGRSFDQQLCVPPDDVLTSNGQRRGKAYANWLVEQRDAGRTPASLDEYELFMRMEDALMRNRSAAEIVGSTTMCQRSVWWTSDAGHKLKARFDGETPSGIWDLKSTSASWRDLPRKCYDLGYIWQAALYTLAAEAAGIPHGEAWEMPFVFVQTVPPFQCRVRTFPRGLCVEAHDEILRTLDWMKACRDTGEFFDPDSETCEEMEFPAYFLPRGGDDE